MTEPVQEEKIFIIGYSLNTVTLVLCLVLGLYFVFRKNPRIKKNLAAIGGPKGLPVMGSALDFLRPHHEYIPLLEGWKDKYGKIFSVWIGNIIPYVFISDPDVVEKILSTTTHINKGKYEYSLLHDWLGTGLLTASRNKWSSRRKMLTPSFHFKILEDFVPIFNEQAAILTDCLEKEADNGKSFNIYPYITKCTLDVICETAMGKKINAQTSDSNKSYMDAVNRMCELLLEKTFKPWNRIQFLYNFTSMSKLEKDYLGQLKGFTESVIQSRRIERKNERRMMKDNDDDDHASENIYGKKRKAFLDLLLDASEDGAALTDDDIREEVDTFMFEGHDTTGVNLAWTILLLSSFPEYQKQVQQELDEIFADDSTRDVTTEDISKMKFLECCVKESLRLYPSVPFIMRQIENDIKLDNGIVIPTGATASVAIYFVHRDPVHFPDPHDFKPERFSAENSLKRHPYAYVPFSAGPRNCIGQKFALMEEKIILAKLFRHYSIQATEKLKDIKAVPDVVLRCLNGVYVTIQKR